MKREEPIMKQERINELLADLGWRLPEKTVIRRGYDGIRLDFDGEALEIEAENDAALGRALTLAKLRANGYPYQHAEKCAFADLGVMVDCSRNAVLSLDGVKRLLRSLCLMGYNMAMLYTEDTYEVDGEPYFGHFRGRFSKDEMKEIDAYARDLGIEMIPCMQTLAHLEQLFHWDTYADVLDCNAILLCGEERTYELIDRMFATLSECFASRRIHIGMDEAHMVGLGRYLDKHGYEDRFDLLTRHLARVAEIAEKYGYHPIMWSDMFFRLSTGGYYLKPGEKIEIPERVFSALPENIGLVYWDYYHQNPEDYAGMIEAHKQFDRDIWFAGGAWKWIGFTPDNTMSLPATDAATRACRTANLRHLFTTAWGDNGAECPIFSVLPTLAHTASLAYGQTAKTATARFFKALTGMTLRDFMAIDALNNLYDVDIRGENPAKYFLYNDPLMGQLDDIAEKHADEVKAHLTPALSALRHAARNETYGYLFRTQVALGELLTLKFDFGVRLRRAYLAGDREGMEACARECAVMRRRLAKFYDAFRVQWLHDNKPQGFDVQDQRLGGLDRRLDACARTIRDYLAGRIPTIAELDEERLPCTTHWKTDYNFASTANRV